MLLNVMTYNVHSFINEKGQNTMSQVCSLIKKYQPVIVGLNEVEKLSPRTRFVDQAKAVAKAVEMNYLFSPTVKIGPFGFFGNALLAKFPILHWENVQLYSKKEFRSCLVASLQLPGTDVQVLVTHLGLNREERVQQINKLAELVSGMSGPVILMGDFNAQSGELGPLLECLRDVGRGSGLTFPAREPRARIDYILLSRDIVDYDVRVLQIDASDHLPVLATIEI